jgi:8-hydroxy-5-deazaflavin:NADPH oxidoreductase
LNIAIVGAGHIGGNIARQLSQARHAITVSFARDLDKLERLALDIAAAAAAPDAAVRHADVVVIAVPWGALPQALYTKSFNTLTAAFQARTAGREPRVVQWLAGDDAAAKLTVAALIRDAGFEPVDVGGTSECAVIEAPRRHGSVYGEEYRLADASAVVETIRAGTPIPPTPAYT